MSTVISVEKVSKLYRLGEIGTGSLAHDVNRWWHKVRGNEDPYLKVGQFNDRSTKGESDYVYAIKDVSFEVKQGEVLGIIGRNGAGKSTLLKILSRVTTPTTGQIKIKGRVASLLEVGTGFHPELTGRENIFLNGAILGMRKSEIRSKFDEIVAFSGCERYIDTPVKRYSSGMYVRLAFAVAAHLEPEILVVDEVLAVGDAEFQDKCIGKMQQVAGDGRTVIFVSHNISAIKRLCSSGVYLRSGNLEQLGAISDVVTSYLQEGERGKTSSSDNVGSFGSKKGRCRFTKWYLGGAENSQENSGISRETFSITFEIESEEMLEDLAIGMVIRNVDNIMMISVNSRDDFSKKILVNPGVNRFEAKVRLPLKMGIYSIDLALVKANGEMIDQWLPERKLVILPNENSVLPQEWRGLLNEPVLFSKISI